MIDDEEIKGHRAIGIIIKKRKLDMLTIKFLFIRKRKKMETICRHATLISMKFGLDGIVCKLCFNFVMSSEL